MKTKHLPPSRIKYNNNHPIVSIRVSPLLKKELEEIKQTSGKSIGDILREAVGIQSKSSKAAFSLGFENAKATFGVSFKCSKCGEDIFIETENAKKAAAQYMQEHGWAHSKCINHTHKTSPESENLALEIVKLAKELGIKQS